jgi:hypothetical protein
LNFARFGYGNQAPVSRILMKFQGMPWWDILYLVANNW